MRSVLHTTPHTYSDFPPARSNSTLACVQEGARTGSFFQRMLDFIRAIAGQKLHLQFLRAIPLFTFTHDSCVMSTICYSKVQIPRGSRFCVSLLQNLESLPAHHGVRQRWPLPSPVAQWHTNQAHRRHPHTMGDAACTWFGLNKTGSLMVSSTLLLFLTHWCPIGQLKA